MPELPEVQTLVLELSPELTGRVILDARFPERSLLKMPASKIREMVVGRTIQGLTRRGKFLGIRLDREVILWIHLGMTGQLFWSADDLRDPHRHFILSFREISDKLIFRDVRKFGKIFVTDGRTELFPHGLRELGPEPFELAEDRFISLFRDRTGRIKNLLMNQKIIAGLGNIYADESLHRAGIHPARRPHRLVKRRLRLLHQAVCETLAEAISKGGSTIDDYRRSDGSNGGFQHLHRVYGRVGKPCGTRGVKVERIRLAGRSAFFCPKCQR